MRLGDGLNPLQYESRREVARWQRKRFVIAAVVTAVLIAVVIRASRPQPVALPSAIASTAPATNDVSEALFLLVRTQPTTDEIFTCPSANAEKWDFGGGSNTALNWNSWNSAIGVQKTLSYTYQNPYSRK